MPAGTPLRVSAPLALCILFLAGGNQACSFAFVDGPPKTHRQLNYFTCTSSNVLPTIDVVLGAITAVETVGLFSARTSLGANTELTAIAAVAAAEAALFTASAISGYGKTSDCREATDELQVRLSRMPPAPGFYSGPQGAFPHQPPPPYDPWISPRPGSFGASPSAPPPPSAGAPASTPKSNPPPAPESEAPGGKPSKP